MEDNMIAEDFKAIKVSNTLLIIGNGFDLNWGLKTSYQDFINSTYWPFRKRCLLSNGLGSYLTRKSHKYWFDLEQALKDYCIQKKTMFYAEFFEHRFDNWAITQNTLNDWRLIIESLYQYLLFAEQLVITKESEASRLLRACCESMIPATIVSFNYTDLNGLAKRIGINGCPSPHYVHGSLKNNNLVLGFNQSQNVPDSFSKMIKSYQDGYNPVNLDSKLQSNDYIIIFGVSINQIDFPHFERLFAQIFNSQDRKKKIWLIVYGQESERNNLNNISKLTGKSIHELKESCYFTVVDVKTEAGKQEITHICELINPS